MPFITMTVSIRTSLCSMALKCLSTSANLLSMSLNFPVIHKNDPKIPAKITTVSACRLSQRFNSFSLFFHIHLCCGNHINPLFAFSSILKNLLIKCRQVNVLLVGGQMVKKLNVGYGVDNGLQGLYPLPVLASRAPGAGDINYPIGSMWIRTTSNQAWILTSVTAGAATWALSSPGSSDVDTLTGDGGGAISPAGGNIILAGGTNITSAGAGNTITFNLDPAIVLATSITSPLYTAAAALNLFAAAGQNVVIKMGDAAGANKVSFVDSTAAEVFALNSVGTLTMAALTVTGAFTQTGGAVNVGMDNLGSAINIGGGNVVKAIAIGGGAGAHTLALGSAAAGAMTLDSAAGISIGAALASDFTVTGASRDLTLASVGGSVGISASESVADAIVIEASGAAGAVQIKAGSNGILIGNEADTAVISLGDFAPTSSRTITIGGGTVITAAVTDTIDIAPDGATTNANSISTVNVNTGTVAVGQLLTNIASGAVTSGTHTTSIASGARAAGTMALNLMTGTGTKTANLGNADGLTTINVKGITLINDSVNVQTSINTGTSSGAIVIGNAAAGAVSVDTAAGISLDAATASNFTVAANLTLASTAGALIESAGTTATIDSVGVLELNSSGAAISIGNDANNFAVNIGTGGSRTVTVGATGGASATIIQSGSGKIDLAGVVGELTADFVDVSGDKITFRASPVAQSTLDTCVIPTGVAATTDLLAFENGMIMEQFVIGTQTILAPRMAAAGLTVSCDLTNAEGKEYNFGAARANSKHSFTIGTSPAFYMQLRFSALDVSALEPAYFGFRKTQANNAAYGAYTDFVAYGLNDGVAPGDCAISTRLNSGAQVDTDTNDAFADASTHTLIINVSAAGVVTFLFDGAPPTVTQAFTFDNGDVVHPFWTHLFNATAGAGDEIYWISMEVGYQ